MGSFAFYKGIGLAVGEEVEPDNPPCGASFRLSEDADGPILRIWRKQQGDALPRNLLVLGCDDIDKTYRDLHSAGYTVEPPVVASYGGKEMYLTDPDGNSILFLD